MVSNTDERQAGPVRWPYLLLAVAIFVLAMVVLAALMQVPELLPQLAAPSPTPLPPTATPTVTPTPTPAVVHPTIHDLGAQVDDAAGTVTFHLEAQVPPERQIAEVILWYDTEAGHQLQRTTDPLSDTVTLSYRLDAAKEGLTTTLTGGELDYWWLVRDSAGETVRAGDTAPLGPTLETMLVTPTPEPPPVDFTWTVSESRHFQFHYAPGSAAERDRFEIGALAEGALARTTTVLDVEFEGQMQIYLVPRVFWQGGAAYGEKVQLISYLDRNYTDIETWSYFTHEGTHALAQDLIQPKENGGGPDGVLVEGLAVWASDGHYRQEPIDEWVAVLASSEEYIALAELRAGPFYDFQHEISYLEGGSFVKFLVERYGLDTLKALYGQATGDVEHDEALVQRLYGQSYAELEAAWLAQLAELSPTPEQAETLDLVVRSFDLMRRYETELDPDARLLPSKAPPEWLSDTLKVFLHRADDPPNVVLETTLIAAQERLDSGDLEGTRSLLDDVEAALDDGGALNRPSLQARHEILELLAVQDRAILRADADAYRETLDHDYVHPVADDDLLQMPFTAFEQEVVRLDIAADGLGAHGMVLVHARLASPSSLADPPFEQDGELFAVVFANRNGQWRLSDRQPLDPTLPTPPALED